MPPSLDPREYEYLWSNFEVNVIFTSSYLSPLFREADIVLTYDWTKRELKYFLSKKDRERIENWALDIFENHFTRWEETIAADIRRGKRLADETEREAAAVGGLSTGELRARFLERVETQLALGDDYFCTEFFAIDKAERIVRAAPQVHRVLRGRLEKAGAIKYTARGVLNQFYNYRAMFKPYADEIGRRLHRNDIEWLRYEEILDLLDGKEVPSSRRNAAYYVLARRLGWHVVEGAAAERILGDFDGHFFPSGRSSLDELIARKGVYTGRAKVLRTVFSDAVADEVRKVEKGDVLIANTTGPEVMAACERAGAIVTDEGGLTSHAAIVSRELGIPCIVGTKVGTKIFKDGDLVEVDAERGIVRKI